MVARIHEEDATRTPQWVANQSSPGGWERSIGGGGEVSVIPAGTLGRVEPQLAHMVARIDIEDVTGTPQWVAGQGGPGGWERSIGGGGDVSIIPACTLGQIEPQLAYMVISIDVEDVT
jgi:hypothetical protein